VWKVIVYCRQGSVLRVEEAETLVYLSYTPAWHAVRAMGQVEIARAVRGGAHAVPHLPLARVAPISYEREIR
jgi:hypothetical protein